MTWIADVRGEIADYIVLLALVYTVIIVAHILVRLAFEFGARVPYSRWSDAIFTFLQDAAEPYLRLFRKIIPMFGPLDLSPIVAIFVLQIGAGLIAAAVRG